MVKNIDIYSHRYTLMALTQLPIYVIHIILIVCSDTPVSSHVMQIAGLVYVAVSTCPCIVYFSIKHVMERSIIPIYGP